jgi:hypothetical protein
MKRISVARVIGAGVVFAIISQCIHTLGSIATIGFYMDPAYFHVWSKIMMPTEGPPPVSFYYYSIAFGIVTGLFLALVYAIIREGVPGTGARRGITYGFLVFLLAGLPGSLSLYLLINLPSALIAYWTLENLVTYLIGGAVFGKLIA